MANDPTYLNLTQGDQDFGILPANEARAQALAIANSTKKIVRLRDIVTDRVLVVVRPVAR